MGIKKQSSFSLSLQNMFVQRPQPMAVNGSAHFLAIQNYNLSFLSLYHFYKCYYLPCLFKRYFSTRSMSSRLQLNLLSTMICPIHESPSATQYHTAKMPPWVIHWSYVVFWAIAIVAQLHQFKTKWRFLLKQLILKLLFSSLFLNFFCRFENFTKLGKLPLPSTQPFSVWPNEVDRFTCPRSGRWACFVKEKIQFCWRNVLKNSCEVKAK